MGRRRSTGDGGVFFVETKKKKNCRKRGVRTMHCDSWHDNPRGRMRARVMCGVLMRLATIRTNVEKKKRKRKSFPGQPGLRLIGLVGPIEEVPEKQKCVRFVWVLEKVLRHPLSFLLCFFFYLSPVIVIKLIPKDLAASEKHKQVGWSLCCSEKQNKPCASCTRDVPQVCEPFKNSPTYRQRSRPAPYSFYLIHLFSGVMCI